METVPTATSPAASSSLHPVLWIAGISVTLLSVVGIAALTGLLPLKTAPAPEPPAITTAAPAAAPAPVAAPQVAAVAPAPVAAPVVAATPAPVVHKTAKKKVEQNLPASSTPPPFASGVPPDYVPPVAAAPAPVRCVNCGVIADVREVTHEGKGSGAGAVIGGLAGGVLGSNVGRGNTRTLATIAGAVGGGLLGNSVEKSQSKTVSYEVTVRLDDGSTRMIDSATLPSWRIGDRVRLVNGAIVSR